VCFARLANLTTTSADVKWHIRYPLTLVQHNIIPPLVRAAAKVFNVFADQVIGSEDNLRFVGGAAHTCMQMP